MKLRNIIIPVFGFTILSIINSCGISEGFGNIQFPEKIPLVGKEILMSDVYLKYPFKIQLNDTTLYVMDIHPMDYYCHEFNYPAMKYKRGFAKRGEAPDEFLDAENIRVDNQGRIWVLDANRKKIACFGNERMSAPQETIPLDEELIRTLDFDLLTDSTFLVPDYTGQYRLSVLDREGNVIRHLFRIPADSKRAGPDFPLAQAWRSFLHYNADHGIVAMVTQLGQVLEIYDIRNERTINIVKSPGAEPRFVTRENYAIPTGIMGYSDVYVSNEYIYAIFWGRSFDDIKQQKVVKEGGRYIHVFDLQGNPVRQYVLDRHITGFHIDEKNKKIIGLDVNSDQPIVEYTYLR